MKQQRICLVSPGHVASNPRLVKEANALHEAGFQVRVVAGDYMAAIRPLDQTILSEAPWAWVQVGLGSKPSYLARRLWQDVARRIAKTGWIPDISMAIWAHSLVSFQLAKAAVVEPADLYIAHNLAALPAAAIAAERHRAKLGFDAEDFHTGELPDTPEYQGEIAVRDRIERTFLPRCQHLTAASPGIAAAYAKRYSVHMEPILNVCPLSEAPTSPNQPQASEPSLYWFSQTIGPGRGIESIVQAMGQMQTPVHLHLRGLLAAEYSEQLMALGQKVGVGDRLHILPPAPPSEMVRLAAPHDMGLCLELTQPLNRAICLTNKIFTYLLAGIPLLISKTPAQEEIYQQLKAAALLVNIEEPTTIAIALDDWFSHPDKFQQARVKAWELGRRFYNWDVEKQKFLHLIDRVLA
ncbi:hypothetical protein H6G74_06460 [Nostoc spongiaeforme FACHB-130]|uniref:Glycosyltransferase n=1 Tax=Nostoc spongiaeforme FACHB-130 TaxID=1357510 RepID=A0ABR8FRA8_9NOSO|nr:hypothetical protein [Nostoc spongiaeforme]MBD2593970.1 hypothetical protein [Nostoc spongiaeforme FACHB-130]